MSVVNAHLVTLLRESLTPLSRGLLHSSCAHFQVPGVEIDDHLRSLSEGARIHPWSKDRFWNDPEIGFYMDHARQWIQTQPLWMSLLIKKLEGLGFNSPRSVYERVFRTLKEQPEVHVWPAHGPLRGESLCLKPLDLSYYLTDLRNHYEAAKQKLTPAYLTEADILEFLSQGPETGHRTALPPQPSSSSSAEPDSESDLDFQRDLSEHLIFCWSGASSTEVREHLELIMHNVGLTPFGLQDEILSYNGIEHRSSEPLFPGDPCRVLEPGWMLQRGPRKRILAKALVSTPT